MADRRARPELLVHGDHVDPLAGREAVGHDDQRDRPRGPLDRGDDVRLWGHDDDAVNAPGDEEVEGLGDLIVQAPVQGDHERGVAHPPCRDLDGGHRRRRPEEVRPRSHDPDGARGFGDR